MDWLTILSLAISCVIADIAIAERMGFMGRGINTLIVGWAQIAVALVRRTAGTGSQLDQLASAEAAQIEAALDSVPAPRGLTQLGPASDPYGFGASTSGTRG